MKLPEFPDVSVIPLREDNTPIMRPKEQPLNQNLRR